MVFERNPKPAARSTTSVRAPARKRLLRSLLLPAQLPLGAMIEGGGFGNHSFHCGCRACIASGEGGLYPAGLTRLGNPGHLRLVGGGAGFGHASDATL